MTRIYKILNYETADTNDNYLDKIKQLLLYLKYNPLYKDFCLIYNFDYFHLTGVFKVTTGAVEGLCSLDFWKSTVVNTDYIIVLDDYKNKKSQFNWPCLKLGWSPWRLGTALSARCCRRPHQPHRLLALVRSHPPTIRSLMTFPNLWAPAALPTPKICSNIVTRLSTNSFLCHSSQLKIFV